jgi:hypothetical protein
VLVGGEEADYASLVRIYNQAWWWGGGVVAWWGGGVVGWCGGVVVWWWDAGVLGCWGAGVLRRFMHKQQLSCA